MLATRLAMQAAQVLADLPQHVHPGWIGALEVDRSLLSAGGAGLLNRALQTRFDLCWPDLSAATEALQMAWLLPPAQLRRVCAARVLYSMRGALARTVDAALRRSARLLIGSDSFEALVGLAERRRVESPTLPAGSDRVVLAGWALIERQLCWGDDRLRRLTVLALPPHAPHAATAAPQEQNPAREHAEFAAAVNQLFPEHQWLFGSKPATLKSA